MNRFIKISLSVILFILLQSTSLFAQKKAHHKHGGNKKVVVVKNHHHHGHKHYKPVYHPVWGPKIGFYRRWVFFPRYNFYWDNLNSQYVYWGGNVWIRTASPPPAIINVNISNEKKYELKEPEDTINDIYGNNSAHKTEYPEN
ncbi:MAG: hypothetical protein Q8M29_01555 [Bacteroidota bacterium]|nr:hypothetical protein [Bacteroidota bacterium]